MYARCYNAEGFALAIIPLGYANGDMAFFLVLFRYGQLVLPSPCMAATYDPAMSIFLFLTLLDVDKSAGTRRCYRMFSLQFTIVNVARNERPDDPRHAI